MKKLNRRHTLWLFSIGFCLFMSLSISANAQDIKINRTGTESDITPPVSDSTLPAAGTISPATENMKQAPVAKKELVKDFDIAAVQGKKINK